MASGWNIICYLPPGLAAVFLILGAAFALKNLHLPAKVDQKSVLPTVKNSGSSSRANELVFPKHLVEIWVTRPGISGHARGGALLP